MKLIKWTILLSGLFAQSACTSVATTVPAQTTNTAVLSNPSAQTTQQLSGAISAFLNGRTVNIAPDAFTRSSQLIIERNTKSPASMPGLNGRIMGVPVTHRFSLMQQGNECYLVYEKTGEKRVLNEVSCRTEH